jgi:hypothetical protein
MPVAADPLIERFLSERGETLAKIEGIKTVALDRERDLTTDELESIQTYSRRIKAIDTQLESVADNNILSETIHERIAMASPSTNVGATSTALLVSCCGMSSTIGRRKPLGAWQLCSAAQLSTWAPQLAALLLWLVALVGSLPAPLLAPLSTWPLRGAPGSTSLGLAARLPL